MAESHSFSPEFYTPEGADPYDPNTWDPNPLEKPKSLLTALYRIRELEPLRFQTMCEATDTDYTSEGAVWDLIDHAKGVDIVDDSCSPIGVRIDEAGDHIVRVW